MNAFYSILYVLITPETSEKLSLGVLLSDGKQSLFRYSRSKLSVVGELLPAPQHEFIKKYVKGILGATQHGRYSNSELDLQFENTAPLVVSEEYVSYLNRYNHNLLTFGDPVNIDIPVNEEFIEKLFARLIHEKPSKLKGRHLLLKTREELKIRVKQYFSFEREVEPEDYPELIMPVTIDFFGKNNQPVYAQFFDFERQVNHVKNDYFDLNQLQDAIKGKGFVISSEPDTKKFPCQHQAWKAIVRNRKIEYLDNSEVEKIEQYAIEHGVLPY